MVGSEGSTIFFNFDTISFSPLHHSKEASTMNKKTVLFTLIAISAAMTSYAQKFILNSLWRDSAIVVDGKPIDWDQPYRYFDSKTKLQYSVVNDDKYVYVSIRTNDDKAQMKIMRAGMDVWFDVSGKKKEIGTVSFPLKSNTKLDMNPDPNEPDQQVVEKPDVRKMKMDWAEALQTVHTQGLKNVLASFSALDSVKQNIEVAISWDRDNVLTYELKVPFSAFFKDAITASDTLKPITIGIKVNAMDLPMIPTNANNTNADVTGSAGGANGLSNTTNGMPNNMNNNTRPQTSMPQPTMGIPKNIADMGIPLVVIMKMKLAFR
jgi:hypothetical protein